MGKTTLTRETLRQNGVLFDSEPASLPSHIDDLKSDLLDFSCTEFGDLGGLDVDLDYEQLKDKSPYYLLWDSEGRQWLEKAKESTTAATHLTAREDNEPEWQDFYAQHFYHRLFNVTKITDKDDRRTARAKFYYEHIEKATQRDWTLFTKGSGYQSNNRKDLTMPKPDWMVAFPVYSAEFFKQINVPSKWLWTEQPKDTVVTNLSKTTLQHLAAQGLYSVIAHRLKTQKYEKNWKLAHHMCFPWLVMEHKKSKQAMEFCYCQTANGTSAAVLLLENLCKYATESHLNRHVPPVIGITTCGLEVKVWITYSSSSGIKMDCIWTGDMTKPVPTLQLHFIFENIHTWATRVLRPRISQYIDQWLVRHPFESPRSPTMEAGSPQHQLTPETQKEQSRQTLIEQASISRETTLTGLGDFFTPLTKSLEPNGQADLSSGEQTSSSGDLSDDDENASSSAQLHVHREIDDRERDDDTSSGDDGDAEDNSQTDTDLEPSIDGLSNYIANRGFLTERDDEKHCAGDDDSVHSVSHVSPSHGTDRCEEPDAVADLNYHPHQDTTSCNNSGQTPRGGISLFPTTLRSTTHTFTRSTGIWSDISKGPFNFNYQSPEAAATQKAPTKSSKSVAMDVVPLRLTPFPTAPSPTKEQLQQDSPVDYEKRKTIKVPWYQERKFIYIRLPRCSTSDRATSYSHHVVETTTTEPKEPEATSAQPSQFLFFLEEENLIQRVVNLPPAPQASP